MINSREVIRRLIKYLVLVLVVALSSFTILVKGNVMLGIEREIFIVSIIGGTTFALLDLMSPSIQLKIDKKCGV
jgi:hypothetical protein